MIGLMARRPPSAASSSIDADHSNHSSSSVMTSRSTLESTSVTRSVFATRQRHQLVGAQAEYRPWPASHMRKEPLAARLRPPLLPDSNAVADDVELDLAMGQQPEPLPDVLRNGDLALGGNAHGITPTSNTHTCGLGRQEAVQWSSHLRTWREFVWRCARARRVLFRARLRTARPGSIPCGP